MVKLFWGVSHTRLSFCFCAHVSGILLCKMIYDHFIKHPSHQFKLVIQTFSMFLRKFSLSPGPTSSNFVFHFSQLVSFKKLF